MENELPNGIVITQDMIEAAREILWASGSWDYPSLSDDLLIEEMLCAAMAHLPAWISGSSDAT